MIPLEDKLRAAIHATAEEVPADPPPLRLGSPGLSSRRRPWFRLWLRPGLGAGRIRAGRIRAGRIRAGRIRAGRIRPGRPGWSTWLAPLAAAAVVVAVILGSLAVTGGGAGRATPATPATRATPAGVPPYYVALTRLGGVFNPGGEDMPVGAIADGAEVRSTATGAVLATIALPQPYEFFGSITAAADDRTFVLSAEEGIGHTQGNRLFVLHIDPTPQGPATSPARHVRVSLEPLPASLPASDSTAMALSPDGTSLAAEIGDRLYVFNLVTGTQRTWSFQSSSGYSFGPGTACRDCDALSWTTDGQHIAFIYFGASASSAAVGLLDTSGPGTNALAVSKPVALSAADTNMTEHWRGAIITPDGRTVLAGADLASKGGPDGLLKVSTATGKVTAILSIPGSDTNSGQVLYTNATGNVLVVSSYPDSRQLGLGLGLNAGILRGDTYTPLPWTATTVTAAW